MVRQRTFLYCFTDHCSKLLEKLGLEGWDPQKNIETWISRLWQNSGVWDQARRSTPSSLLRCTGGEDRAVSPPHYDPECDLGSHSCNPITLTVIHLFKRGLVWLEWWKGLLRAWSAFQDPAAAEMPKNPAASVQSCTQAKVLLLLAASDLTWGSVDSWGLPKAQKVLCLCCNACILCSLLCWADCLDPHWASFVLTPTVSLAISLSLTSVFTGEIIEKKVTRQSGHRLTGSDCLQLSGQGWRHPGREQRWGVRADSIITTLSCPQRLKVTRRSERKMSS